MQEERLRIVVAERHHENLPLLQAAGQRILEGAPHRQPVPVIRQRLHLADPFAGGVVDHLLRPRVDGLADRTAGPRLRPAGFQPDHKAVRFFVHRFDRSLCEQRLGVVQHQVADRDIPAFAQENSHAAPVAEQDFGAGFPGDFRILKSGQEPVAAVRGLSGQKIPACRNPQHLPPRMVADCFKGLRERAGIVRHAVPFRSEFPDRNRPEIAFVVRLAAGGQLILEIRGECPQVPDSTPGEHRRIRRRPGQLAPDEADQVAGDFKPLAHPVVEKLVSGIQRLELRPEPVDLPDQSGKLCGGFRTNARRLFRREISRIITGSRRSLRRPGPKQQHGTTQHGK